MDLVCSRLQDNLTRSPEEIRLVFSETYSFSYCTYFINFIYLLMLSRC
jgi:hypothetical protein